MATWLVSRHPGAIEWIEQQGLPIDERITHLDPERLTAGDTVVGSLPIQLVAELTERNIRYLHLEMKVPEYLRGHELTASEMDQCAAQLQAYRAERIDNWENA